MLFKFNREEYDFLIKYLDWEDLNEPYELRSDKCEILIADNEDKDFMSLISEISVIYGMDEDQNRLTEIGDMALSIYDKLYFKVFE